MPSLKIICGGVEERFDVEASAVTLGRGIENDIPLKDVKASRRHCQIVQEAGEYKLVDLGGGNGTFLNGARMATEAKLNSGDRIQIGGTVIIFQAGASARPGETTGSGSGAVRKKPSTAQIALSGRPTQRTEAGGKKTTTRIMTGAATATSRKKSTTSQLLRPADAPPKSGTARMGTRRNSKTASFAAAAGRRRIHPGIIAGAVVGAIVVLFTVGLVVFGGDDEGRFLNNKMKFEDLVAQGAKAEDDRFYNKAVRKYREAIQVAKEEERLRSQVSAIELRIKDAERSKEVLKEAEDKFLAFKSEYDRSPRGKSVEELLKEAIDLRFRFQATNPSWLAELNTCIEALDRAKKAEDAAQRRLGFLEFRNAVNGEFSLDKGKDALWGPAIVKWKAGFLNNPKVAPNDASRAETEVQSLEGRAMELFQRTVRPRAERLAKDEGKAEALKWCEENLKRLQGSKVEADLRALMEKFK
ncbi:MAG: FHA domain-containing protein [Planctomycetes bacterium]|nr:FHA domain-containing protein [Planctomycetota bacterium]